MSVPRPTSAQSAISSAMSDDEERSRPPSGVSHPSQSAAAQSQSRRAAGPPPSHPASTANTSRPHSSASRVSRSHVPSLTSHAFYRPMTSQQAQRQRGARPNTGRNAQSAVADDIGNDIVSEGRNSMSTVPRENYGQREDPEVVLPPSRGTEYTETGRQDRTNTATNNATVRNVSDNVRLLKDRDLQQDQPRPSTLGSNFNNGVPQEQPPQKSPRGSFRSNFSLGTKRHSLGPGHQHLSSTASSPRFDVGKPPEKPRQQADLGRNYEYFEGNTVFFMGGRLQNARDRPVNIATGIGVLIPSVLFFIFCASWLWHNISPAIPVVFGYIFYVCLSSFIHASLVDPGVFPRNLHPLPPTDPNEDLLTIGPPLNDWVMVKLATSETAAMDVPVKYCKTCNIWRPPRCYHCRVCDSCIETLDHHCVWINNCVGRRNYRYFFTFLCASTIGSLYLIGAPLAQVLVYRARQGITFGAAIDHFRVPFAIAIYGIIALPYPASLLVYHLYLTGKGETTREYLTSHKFAKSDRHLPFTQGNFFKNWIAVLARPRPPTYLHFKQKYEDGDQRFGQRKGKRQAPLVEEAQGGGMEMKTLEAGGRGAANPLAFEGPSGRPQVPR